MLYLASQSPRRHELLKQIGIPHRVIQATVDETVRAGESAADYVRRLALAKARAGQALHHDAAVLGADTAVVLDDRILGKPCDREQGLAMLAALSGREHRVLTGVALVYTNHAEVRLSENRVRFRHIDPGEAARYWASGEPADKAGGYAIQGLGAVFVSELAGSFSGVMGLPLYETAEILASAGIKLSWQE